MGNKNLRIKIKTNKLSHNPLFIKFLNWKKDKHTIQNILIGLEKSFSREEDKKIVRDRLSILNEDYLIELEEFQKRFSTYVTSSILNNNTSEEFLMWMSNISKYIEEEIVTYLNDESRQIKIIKFDGKWLESIIVYNFITTFNNFGLDVIKLCPCSKFFSHKGKYAKYCSEECKSKGMKK